MLVVYSRSSPLLIDYLLGVHVFEALTGMHDSLPPVPTVTRTSRDFRKAPSTPVEKDCICSLIMNDRDAGVLNRKLESFRSQQAGCRSHPEAPLRSNARALTEARTRLRT